MTTTEPLRLLAFAYRGRNLITDNLDRFRIIIIDRSEDSPLADHHPFEVGYDPAAASPTSYVCRVFLDTYGSLSVYNACEKSYNATH